MDPVTQYATDVIEGRIVAGRLVKLACQRHLDDLARAAEKGLVWKPEAAQRIIDFFAEVLCLPEETAADEVVGAPPVDGSPFILQPFQQFIVGSLFGWYTVKGYRRFRDSYEETGKGSGKTPKGAGVMLYMTVADDERGAQCYFAANTMPQAREAGMTDAEKMVKASPFLRDHLDQKVNNLAVLDTGSFLRAISSEKRGLDGKRVHGAFIDEEHEHRTHDVVSKVRRGTKGRRNALVMRATNSGFDRLSICWHDHEYSRKVLEGTITDDSWFAYICGLDPCQACLDKGRQFPDEDCKACDDWKVEGPHWLKANPNLGVSISWQYLRELVKQAKGRPDAVGDLLRFNFCVWTSAHTQAWGMAKWHECGRNLKFTDEDLVGAKCWGGLDLGQTDDFAAWARLFELEHFFVLKMRFWLPQAALEKYPNRPYDEWRRAGILDVTDGDTTDVDLIEEQVLADCRTDGIIEVGYDKRFAHQLALHLQGAGIAMVDTPQGYALNESIKSLSKLIVDIQIAHGNHAIMTWMMDNTVLRTGRNREQRIDKDVAREKIDGPSALIMANARRIAQPLKKTPDYQIYVYGANR